LRFVRPRSGLGRREAIAALFVLAFLAAATTVIVARVAFPNGTADLDEVAYESQANAIAHRDVTLPATTHDPFFRPYLSGVRDDRVVFKYQPEWPALIAVSEGVFGSTLPLRTLMAIGGVLTTAWLARELVGDRRVVVTAAALVAASPFAWLQSASLLGYQLSFVLGTAAAAALVRSSNRRSTASGLAAGALLGLAIFHRPFDALLATGPVIAAWVWCAWRRRALIRSAAPIAIGGLPFAAAFLAYNRAAIGSAFRLAYNVTGPSDAFGFGWRASFTVPGGGRDGQLHYTFGRALSTLGHLFVVLPRFVAFAPVVAVLAGVVIWLRRRDMRLWLLVAMVVIVVFGYFWWWGPANSYHFELDRSLGPFYYYPVLAPLCVLAAWGLTLIRRSLVAVVVMSVTAIVWAGVASVSVARDARDAGSARTTEVNALHASERSLILESPLFPNDPYLRVETDATLRGAHLVAVDVPDRRFELVDRFPGRGLYLVRTYRHFGDLLGPEQHDRVALGVVHGREVIARVHVTLASGRAGRVYLRIGNAAPRLSTAGRGDFVASIRVPAASVATRGASTRIAVGVTVAEAGEPVGTILTNNWFECRADARVTSAHEVEVLQPCDGRHHYTFPNGATATAVEDVSPALRVELESI
jgi:hypothetical protein